jgi:hypothetical protein
MMRSGPIHTNVELHAALPAVHLSATMKMFGNSMFYVFGFAIFSLSSVIAAATLGM